MAATFCRRVTVILLGFALAVSGCSLAGRNDKRTIVLVSIDGLRWDYPDSAKTPNMDFLAEHGVKAKWLVPVFPTKTFPNHYSIATGLYPEHHGMVANNMWDPIRDRTFSLRDREAVKDPDWWGGEPIWVTAEKQGRIAAAFFWPGTETAIEGVRPTFWREYDGSIPDTERVEQVLRWLALPPDERPSLITLYFSDVDDAGHDYGPLSPRTWEVVSRIDSVLGMLIDGVRASGNRSVDVILVSDHGMTGISRGRVVFLDEYVDLDDVRVSDWAPVTAVWPKPGKDSVIYSRLRKIEHVEVYRKDEIPERYHYRANPRIAPIIVVADHGWLISSHGRFEPESVHPGTHGYANDDRDMYAVFMAWGPDFKEGLLVEPFQNVHIYAMLARLLDLVPAPNDGAFDSVRVMLK